MSDPKPDWRAGEKNGRSRLSARGVRMIRRAVRDGVQQKMLAEAYGVHRSTISLAVLGKTWRHVP